MKALLLAACLLTTAPALAQTAPPVGQESPVAFKRASVIILHTTDSTAAAYANMGRVLLAAGCPIDKSDKELGYINTSYHPGRNKAVEQAYRIAIVSHHGVATIEIRGVCKMPALRNNVFAGETPIDFRSAFGSAAGESWKEMLALAEAYHAPSITYK